MAEDSDFNAIELATELTIAWLGNPNSRVSAEEVPGFLQKMYATVTGLAAPTSGPQPADDGAASAGAVSVRKSLASKDHILSMIDGKPYKTLRRHLSTHGMTPDDYRQRFGLKSDYPMVAESYSTARREMAKKIGLGRKPGVKMEKAPGAPKPAARARKKEVVEA